MPPILHIPSKRQNKILQNSKTLLFLRRSGFMPDLRWKGSVFSGFDTLLLMLIFFPGRHTAPNMPLGLIVFQDALDFTV